MTKDLFTPDPSLPEGHFDVLVIGSGMGGLTAALLLAKEGFKVCVVEQHYRPGGCLHRFFRKGVPFDTGFHYLGGVDPGGTFNQYLKFLGVRDSLSFHPLDPDGYDVLRLPGYEFKVPAGWAPFTRRLVSEFPAERAAIERFTAICQKICTESFAYSFKKPPDTLGEFAEITLGALMRSLGMSDRLRAVLSVQGFLYGVPPDQTPIELHALVIDSMMQGPVGLDGGGDQLARVMVEAIKAHGGQVRTRVRITGLTMKDGALESATTEQMKSSGPVAGEPIFARMFISNAHPQLTLDLLPAGALRPAYTTRVRQMTNSIACIGGYYSTTQVTEPKRRYNIYGVPTWNVDQMYSEATFGEGKGEGKAMFLTFPADREPGWEGPRLVLSLGVMPFSEVARFQASHTGHRGPEYEAFKRREADALRRAVESHLPEHAGHLTEIDVSTPLTNRDYAGAVEGGIYGLRHSMDRWGRYALHTRTKIPNLMLTGHSVLMPGIIGVTIGAFVTCSYLLGFEALFDRVASA